MDNLKNPPLSCLLRATRPATCRTAAGAVPVQNLGLRRHGKADDRILRFRFDHVLADHGVSGVGTRLAERPEGRRLFDMLPAGDTLVVRWVDRLGRNYADVTDVIREFIRRGVIVCTVINGLTFDGATKDPMQMAVRDALIGFMAATAQAQAEATKEAQHGRHRRLRRQCLHDRRRFGPRPRSKVKPQSPLGAIMSAIPARVPMVTTETRRGPRCLPGRRAARIAFPGRAARCSEADRDLPRKLPMTSPQNPPQ